MCCLIGLISTVSFSQNTNTLPLTGNVGVGTTTPSVPLDVVGGTKLGGTVVIDSTVVIKDSLTINKRLTIKQDIKVVGKSVFVDDVKSKANLRVLGVARMKDKLVVDGLTKMKGNANVFGNFRIKSIADTSLTTNRLVSINPNGKLIISSLKLAQDDTYVCSPINVAPWVYADGTLTDDDILLCPNYKSVTIGGDFNVHGKSILKTAGIGNVLPTEIGASLPTFYVKRGGFPNAIVAKFEAGNSTSSRSIFFSNTLANGGHNLLSKVGDVGMFWSNPGFNSGIVLGPESSSAIGVRINNRGRFGFNAPIINQVQYVMNSNSFIGLLVKTNQDGAYGIRALTSDASAVAISVANNPDIFPTNNSGVFSVLGSGEVTIRTDASQPIKSFTVKDITNSNNLTNDVFKIMSNGNVFATRVRVMDAVDFPDYVFDATTYELMPLQQLENYLTTNKHLPNMPTAEQVKEEGLDLGEINKVLVQKVEELTLYMIQMNKEIEQLKAANNSLKK